MTACHKLSVTSQLMTIIRTLNDSVYRSYRQYVIRKSSMLYFCIRMGLVYL